VFGEIEVRQNGSYSTAVTGVETYYVNGKAIAAGMHHEHSKPFPLFMTEGKHQVRFQVTGSGNRASKVFLKNFEFVNHTPFMVYIEDTIVPDIVSGKLSSPYISISIVNTSPFHIEDLEVQVDGRTEPRDNASQISFTTNDFFPILPGQPFPLSIDLQTFTNYTWNNCQGNQLIVTLIIPSANYSQTLNLDLRCKEYGAGSYRFTFIDNDNTVQFASVLPPIQQCPTRGCPVVLATLDRDHSSYDEANTVNYRRQRAAFVLLPMNKYPIGFDWESTGYLTGLNALEYLGENQPGVPDNSRDAYKVDITRRIYTGVGGGGHGALVYGTHQPDYALAVSPVSGWTRRELYSPTPARGDYAFTEQFIRCMHQSNFQEYDVDLYASNLLGIPLMVRTSVQDSDYPAFFLKRMGRVVNELSGNASYTRVSEVAGDGKDQTVDDDEFQSFLDEHLYKEDRPSLPKEFTIVLANPSNFKGRGGIFVLQQFHSRRLSKIQVKRDSDQWLIRTHNVRRLAFYHLEGLEKPKSIAIDGDDFEGIPEPYENAGIHYCKVQMEDSWNLCNNTMWPRKERSPDNYGPIRKVTFIPSSHSII
jgi:hypothetical protein